MPRPREFLQREAVLSRRGAALGSLIVSLFLFIQAGTGNAQVAVYDVQFTCDEERNVNFPFFEGGYLCVDLLSGLGSFLMTYEEVRDGTLQTYFIPAAEAAQVFTAVDHERRITVIRATSASPTALAHYLALGPADYPLPSGSPGGEETVTIASRLQGQVLASDDESDVKFPPGSPALGFAGFAHIELTLDADLTESCNRQAKTLSDSIALLTRRLELLGLVRDAE